MDLNDLELFAKVAQEQSFSLAAKKLGLPKSTVSRGIARLEGDLGVQLLLRTTRQVSLTTAGAELRARVAPQLASLRKAVGELPETEEQPSGHLRITSVVDFGATVLPELVSLFLARCPQVTVEVSLSNEVVDLVAERFDLAFRGAGGRLKDSSLHARKAGGLAMQLFAAPTYLARRGTPRTPRDLAAHDWVVFRNSQKIVLHGPGESATIEPKGRLLADELFFVKEAVRQGAGIGFLPSFLADREIASGQLERLLPRWDLTTGALWIVSPGGRHVPKKVQVFSDFAVEYLRTHPLTVA